jgi:hypothetical protein
MIVFSWRVVLPDTRSKYSKMTDTFYTIYLSGKRKLAIPVGRKVYWLLIFPLLLLSSRSFAQSSTQPLTIHLRPATLAFTPSEFYITNIVDKRDNRQAVAYLLPAANPAGASATISPVALEGGDFNAIRQFIRQSVPKNTKLRPVTVRLKQCIITEAPAGNGRVNGQVIISMAFDYERDGEMIHLVEYTGGGASYNRSANQLTAVEQALRQSLGSALKFFNTWINEEASRSEKLAKDLRVSFTDYTRNVEEDTIFYSGDRPLIWDDFREKPRNNRFAASIFPSFAYEGRSEVINGIVHINVVMKVYMLKNSSWVKEGARDDYGLNHEQRHFDIVKLVAERFKQKIQPDSLTIEDYNSIMQYHYLESYREMNRLQEQYDQETRHGLDQAAQERWNRRIDQELALITAKESE